MERQIRGAVALHGCGKLDIHILCNGFRAVAFGIARQVGGVGIRSFFQATCHANQVLYAHVGGKQITAGFGNLTLYVDRRRVHFGRVAVKDEPVPRLKQHVVRRISS